ncbi:MAG: DEAD/DEAH box helicase [Bacteroidetes bacterium]|nr:MAG: DEAD/DEAH box helicase [Bacteroidota bacterium]
MKFSAYKIAPELKQQLQAMGFRRPTDIQYKAIPPIMKGEDVLAIAQTGTGKTAAFAIPVLDRLHREGVRGGAGQIPCLVMVPTHELARQVAGVFAELGKRTQVRVLALHGGTDQAPQIQQLQQGVEVLVATPGRLFDLQSQGHLHLEAVQVLILDEADHMLDLGFIKDIRQLVRRLPRERQTLFFSATIDEGIKKLAYSLVRKAIRIQISPKDPVSKNIDHAVVQVPADEKRFFLERLVREHPEDKMLVFVRTRVRAERVAKALARAGLEAETIHGAKGQADRQDIMARFGNGALKVLIATDVSARGIDIPGVRYVINYDLPEQAEQYVHRVGRTGRGQARGQAIAFCAENEAETLADIEAYLGRPITRLEVDQTEKADTLAMTQDIDGDWRRLMKDIQAEETSFVKKKKKRKGRKS